jgi:acyl CoA:acetate/3-ketoacid CoA transferase beta subunit
VSGRVRRVALVVLCALPLSGCGFVAAGQTSHQKPNNFVLYGHADVPLSTDEHRATGTVCTAPQSVRGIAVTTPVDVLSAGGTRLAHGSLGAGVVARTGNLASCDFPFQIRGVPGGAQTYQIAVGDRPAQTFLGSDLQHNTPAIITITP